MLLRRLVAAAASLVGIAAATVVVSSPAVAKESCAGTIVAVENGSLGGGTTWSCSTHGGNARDLFTAAGHVLRDAARAPGAVCTVDGLPADNPCVQMPPGDAYWGLFSTDGETGRWVYSSLGVDSLDVPSGGGVDFVWQGSSTETAPSVAAPVVAATSPSPRPSSAPHSAPPSMRASVPAVGPVTLTPTRTPAPRSSAKSSPKASAEPTRPSDIVGSETPTQGPPLGMGGDVVSTASQPGDHAVPGWAAPLVGAVIVVAIALIAGSRRRGRR